MKHCPAKHQPAQHHAQHPLAQAAILGLLLTACSSGQRVEEQSPSTSDFNRTCVETEYALDGTEPVDEDAVWPLVEAFNPTTVTWSLALSDDATSTISVSLERGEGDATIIERTANELLTICRHDPELRIPMTATLDVGDGSATSVFDAYIDAGSSSPDEIYFSSAGGLFGPAYGLTTYSDDWQARVDTWLDDDIVADKPGDIIELRFWLSGGPSSPTISLEAWGPNWSATAWRGELD